MSGHARAEIRRALPPETFTPRPVRALLIPLWFGVSAGLIATILFAGLPWWADLGLAIVLGTTFGNGGFAAHEVMHGSTVRGRRAQDVLGWFGFMPFLVSPHLWREWHNKRHHSHANQGIADPDAFSDVRHYRKGGARRVSLPLLPGSGTLISYAFLFYWFTFHNLTILFIMSKRFRGFKRRRAVLETALAALIWVPIAALSGWEIVFTMLIPMAIGNAIVMSYIATNHMMRPETRDHDVVETTMSVRVPWLVDVYQGWFSHHIEHHLFPSMSPVQTPKVRAWFQANAPLDYVAPRLGKAVWWLYRTPRPYEGHRVLVHPDHPERRIDLDKLTEELRDDRWSRLAPSEPDEPRPADEVAA